MTAVEHHQRGWARALEGDLEGELAEWTRAIELDPNFAAAYADRGVARFALGDVEGAREDWKRAIQLEPNREAVLGPLLERERPSLSLTRGDFFRLAAGASLLAGCAGTSRQSDLRWGMIIDLRRCVGCRACTVACKSENHTPPGVAYTVVLEEEVGEFPNVTRRFIPRPCMQCAKSSCTLVCPTGATYHRPDGIVAIDYDKCIGCKYCISACPYGARSFDYGENYGTTHEKLPSPEYGQNRKREKGASPIGNARKCTFCLHRVTNGLSPACAETCIGHAIHFGNLNDPEAKCTVHGEKLRDLLTSRSHMRLKEELGNEPSVYYLT